MNKFNIGSAAIDGNIILAPMAGVTDLPFRLLCKEYGASLVYTEMVSAKGLIYKNKNTETLLTTDDRERPAAVQLFGSEPEIVAEAAALIEHRNFDIIDINMGCPVPKIVNNGEGSALMKDHKLAGKIIDAVVKAVKKLSERTTTALKNLRKWRNITGRRQLPYMQGQESSIIPERRI